MKTIEDAQTEYPSGSRAFAKIGERSFFVMIRSWSMAQGDKEPWARVVLGTDITSLPYSALSKEGA